MTPDPPASSTPAEASGTVQNRPITAEMATLNAARGELPWPERRPWNWRRNLRKGMKWARSSGARNPPKPAGAKVPEPAPRSRNAL